MEQVEKIHKEVNPYKLEDLIAGGAGGMKDKKEAFGMATRQSLSAVIFPNTNIQRAIKKVAWEGNNSTAFGSVVRKFVQILNDVVLILFIIVFKSKFSSETIINCGTIFVKH